MAAPGANHHPPYQGGAYFSSTERGRTHLGYYNPGLCPEIKARDLNVQSPVN